jgi:retinol-binding protein 3
VLKRLNDAYVFPETARKMETAIRERMQRKEYDSMTSPAAFAERLTAHLQEVSHDKHLRVVHSERPSPVERESQPDPDEMARMRRFMESRNYAFKKVERLDGNVGYLEFEAFTSPELAGDTAAAAMSFLANTSALIIDLRRNGGGDPAMVALLCSYFFDGRPVHLNDLYWREGDRTQQFWTLPYVPGKRYVGKEIYVLTSKRTFSGAEEFTYNLKNLKRATIVGETTGGGAHPGGTQRINAHFAVWVPSGRAVSPITKTNWEGTGVTPDVDVPADQAMKTAYLMALKRLREKNTDEERNRDLDRAIDAAEKDLAALKEKSQG